MASGGGAEDPPMEEGTIPLDIDNIQMLLQVEQEQIQKRTFTNWINAQLSKRTPPSVVLDLFSDLRDGTRLLDLLEVMSGQRMKREKGRGVFQHRSNIETALNFLKKKSIKLVNINVPDIIDGRPSIILGLVWSIILHCHIEELANTLSFSSRHSSLESLESLPSQDSPRSSPAQHRASPLHARFRVSAKKALLLWVREQCSRAGCTLNIRDFKSSWRSGVAFLAILHSLRPDLVDLSEAENRTNQQNLEEAFRLAERELRIPRLLEPEDVDIKDPDEKSIMTYVAQFLQYSKDLPVPEEDSQATSSQKVREVTLWLQKAHQELLEVWGSTEGRSYAQRYQAFQTFVVPFEEQRRHVMPMLSAARSHSHLSEEQRALRQAFDVLAEEVQRYETQLDQSLPAPLDAVGRWLLQVERVLTEEDGHMQDHAHAAQTARHKREQLKASMKEMGVHLQTLQTFPNTDEYGDTLVPSDKLDQIKRRFTSARVTAKYHGIKLEFQECRHSVLDQLSQMDCKIRSWREHYSSQEAVRKRLQDWHETVDKQGLVSQLEAALLRMKAVASNYTSKSALVEDSQRVARLVREAETESALRTEAVAAARGALQRALSAWDDYNQDLHALQAWLGQEATRTPSGGTEVMSESLSQWSARQAHLNEVGNLLIEGTDAETSRALAGELQALNKQWAIFITRTKFAVSPPPGGAPKKPHMVQALTQEAMLLLREPLEVSSTSLCLYRKRLQLMVTKLKEIDLDSHATSADFSGEILQKLRLNVHEVLQALGGADRASEELQRNASALEGRVAELEHWDTEAREVYWLLKEGERRGQWGHDPRAKVLISRGLQLEGQVVTEHQDFQAGVATVRRNWPLLCLSGSEMQDRVRHALTQSQEAVGMLSSLGARRHQSPGEAQPPAKIFIQMGEKPHSTDPQPQLQNDPQPPTGPQLQYPTDPQPQELNDPSTPVLAQLRPFTYAQAVVQRQAKASHQPQAHTQSSPLTPIHSQAKIQPQAYSKAILQTLDPAVLEEFLRSAEGVGPFCSAAQLREVEALTHSVRTQWEACLSVEDSVAQACQHMGALRELCNLLTSEGTHCLSEVQLKECERRMQTVQRTFGEDRDTLPSQARHRRKGTTEELCQQDSPEGLIVSKFSQVIVRADSMEVKQTAEHTVIQAFPMEKESAEQEELERYQASSNAFEAQLEQNQKSLQTEFPPGSVTLSALRAHLQELQRLKEETERLWFEFELQYSQCSQMEGVGRGMEEHRNKLLQQWRGQQIWLQRRMKSLRTTLELVGSVDDDMARISERLDLLFEKPKEIRALALAEATVMQEHIKDLEEGIQHGMDRLSSVDREDGAVPDELDPDERLALGRATLGCRRMLDELRQRVFRAGAAVRALDRFLATLRGVERDVAGVWAPAPQGGVGAARDCRARLAGVRRCVREAGDEAARLDRLLGEARLSLVRDAAPVSCQDLVLELVRRLEEADAHFAQRMQEGAGQEMPLLGERRRVLRTVLQEVRGAAESQVLKEPTLPALQHRMRALADMQAQLTAQRTELEILQQAPETGRGSEDPTEELETLWEEAHRTVTERQEQCRTLTDLLKRFQTSRGRLGATLQRAELTLSEHTSYVAKDNLQRLITKVRGIKEDLAGLSEGVDEIRGVCRQLQSQLRKVPGCPDAPFESEADDLVDRWLDVTEKTDSHMDSLQLGLALWEKLLQLGGEVEGSTGNKLAILMEAHPFQSDQEVMDLQNEIREQEKNLEHFHRRSSEIQVLLQSKEPPLDLQVMESQLRKRMEQVKELFSESRDLFQHLTAVRGHITTRMAECQSSLRDIQSSLSALSTSQTSPPLLQIEVPSDYALSAQLQSQVEQTDALLEEVRLLAGVASPQILEALAAEGLLLKEDIRTTQELIDHKRAQLERGVLVVTEGGQGHIKDGQQGLKGALSSQPLGNLVGEQVVQVGRGCRDDRGDGGAPMPTLTGTSQVPPAVECHISAETPQPEKKVVALVLDTNSLYIQSPETCHPAHSDILRIVSTGTPGVAATPKGPHAVHVPPSGTAAPAEAERVRSSRGQVVGTQSIGAARLKETQEETPHTDPVLGLRKDQLPIPGVDPPGICPEQEEHVQTSLSQPSENLCIRATGPHERVKAEDYGSTRHLDSTSLAKFPQRPGGSRMENLSTMESGEEVQVAPWGQNVPQDPACRHTTLDNRTAVQYLESEPNWYITEDVPPRGDKEFLDTPVRDLETRLTRLVLRIVGCRNRPTRLEPGAMAQQVEEAEDCKRCMQEQVAALSQLDAAEGGNSEALKRMERQWSAALVEASSTIAAKKTQIELVAQLDRQKQAASTSLDRLGTELRALTLGPTESSTVQAEKLQTLLQGVEREGAVMEELLQVCGQVSPHLGEADRAAALACVSDLRDGWQALRGDAERALRRASAHARETAAISLEGREIRTRLESIRCSLGPLEPSLSPDSAVQRAVISSELAATTRQYLRLQRLTEALTQTLLGEREKEYVRQALQGVKEELDLVEVKLSARPPGFESPVLGRIVQAIQDDLTWAKRVEGDLTGRKRVALLPQEAREQIAGLRRLQKEASEKRAAVEPLLRDLEGLASEPEREGVSAAISAAAALRDLTERVTAATAKAVREAEAGLRGREEVWARIEEAEAWVAAYTEREVSGDGDLDGGVPHLEHSLRHHLHALEDAEKRAAATRDLLVRARAVAPELSAADSHRLGDTLAGLRKEVEGIISCERANCEGLQELVRERASAAETLVALEESLRQISTDLEGLGSPLSPASLSAAEPMRERILELRAQLEGLRHCEEDRRRALLKAARKLQQRAEALEQRAREYRRYEHLAQRAEDLGAAAGGRVARADGLESWKALLTQLSLLRVLCRDAAEQLRRIAPDLDPSCLATEQRRVRQVEQSIAALEGVARSGTEVQEQALPASLTYSTEHDTVVGLLQRAGAELERMGRVVPEERALEEELWRCASLRSSVETRLGVLETLRHREAPGERGLDPKHAALQEQGRAFLRQCDMHMESLSQAKAALRDYHTATRDTVWFLQDAQSVLHPVPNRDGDCAADELHQALAAMEEGFQAHVTRLQMLVPQQDCLSTPEVKQLHCRTLEKLLVEQAALQAQGQLQLETLHRCADTRRILRKCLEGIGQRLKSAETSLSECIAHKPASYEECLNQQAKLRVILEELDALQGALSGQLAEQRKWCLVPGCGRDAEGTLGALWRRWAQLRGLARRLRGRSERRGGEWKDIAGAVKTAKATLERLEAELPANCKEMTPEELQRFLGRLEQNKDCVEFESHALTALDLRVSSLLGVPAHQGQATPTQLCEELQAMQGHYRNLREKCILGQEAVRSEVQEREQVQEDIRAIRKKLAGTTSLLCGLEQLPSSRTLQEVRTELVSQNAMLQGIMDGVRRKYTENRIQVPTEIEYPLQEVACLLKELERKVEEAGEKSSPLHRLSHSMTEVVEGLRAVQALLQQKSSSVTEAQTIQKRVWDRLDEWHSCMAVLEGEVQDMWAEHPEQAHLLMDRLMEPLELYQQVAKQAEQRTAFLSRVPALLQEYEEMIDSSSRWLNEAQSWLDTPCSYSTAKCLSSHAQGLQTVLDDSEQMRKSLQAFVPVLQEIAAVCDTAAMEEQLVRADQRIAGVQQGIVGPLAQLQYTAAEVVAMETEVKVMEKNVTKIRTILSSIDTASITPEEHLRNRQVILDNVQSMRRTISEIQRCESGLELPEGGSGTLSIFQRAQQLLQPIQDLEQLTKEQCISLKAAIELSMEQRRTSSSALMEAMMPRVPLSTLDDLKGPWEMALSHEKEEEKEGEEEEDRRSSHSSSSGTLTGSFAEDPDETFPGEGYGAGAGTGVPAFSLSTDEVFEPSPSPLPSAMELLKESRLLRSRDGTQIEGVMAGSPGTQDPRIFVRRTHLTDTVNMPSPKMYAGVVEKTPASGTVRMQSQGTSPTPGSSEDPCSKYTHPEATHRAAQKKKTAESATVGMHAEPVEASRAPKVDTSTAAPAPALPPGETRPTEEGLHSCQEQAAHVADWLEKARQHLEGGGLAMAPQDDIEQQLQTCQDMLLQMERKVASLSAGGQQGAEALSSKLHLLKTNLLTFQLLLQGRWREEEKRLQPEERPPAAGLTSSTNVPALTSDVIQQSHLQQREYECDLKEQRDLAQDVVRLVSRRRLCRSSHETQTQPGSETEARTAPTQPGGGTQADTQMAAKLNSLKEAVHHTLPEAAAQLLVELWIPGTQGSVQMEEGISQQQAVIELEDVFGSPWSWVREFQEEPGENLDLQQGYKGLLQGLTGLVEEGRERLVRSRDLHLRSQADLQTLLSRHKKYFRDLGAHLAAVRQLSVRVPEAELWRQESSRAELEREVGALQQQAVEEGARLQTTLEAWTRWEDSCERLGTLLQEAEARLPGVGLAEESGDQLQERLEVYQQTEALLEENEVRLLQALDLGRGLCTGGRCGGVGVALRGLEARWLAVKKRAEQERLHIEELGSHWNRFQHDSEALSEWVANARDRLQAWRGLSVTEVQEPAHLRSHLLQLLELAKEADSRLALKASVISSGEELRRQRGREALDPRVQPEQLERSWAEILDTLPNVQRRLHQLLMEKLSLEEVMADLDSWLGGMESRLAVERERVHQASCTADLSQLLQHHQEYKQEVALHQLSLDFLNQSVGGTSGPVDIWEKRDERTRFAEQLGTLNLRWVSLQGALVSHGQRVEQLQQICTDRENKLQLLRSWVITETTTVGEFQRPSSLSRAQTDLVASRDTEEKLKVKSAELQELRKNCQSGEQESDCAFAAQLDAVWADFTALSQQITAARPGQLQVAELWERFNEELGRAALETAKFRHTLEFTRTPQLSLTALQGHAHNLQVLQDRVREGEEAWETISQTWSSLRDMVSPTAALLLSEWLEEEKARWAELIQQVTDDLQKARALLQLWQRYGSLTEGCSQGLRHHREQWGALLIVPLPQDGSVEPLQTRVEAINVLQAGMEGLQARMGAVLDASKDLIGQMEPQAAVFIQSETQLLSQGLAQLGGSLMGRQSQLQKDLDLLKDFHSRLESLEQHLKDFDSKLHRTTGPDQSQITKSDLLELTALTSDLEALRETRHLVPCGSAAARGLEELGRRCTLASSRASERCSELQAEELQQRSLQQKCESWVDFLRSVEASLAEQSIIGCPSDLQEQLASHQRLQVEVSLGCHALHSLVSEALDVLERGEVEDRCDFVRKLARLTESWWGTVQEVRRRCALVQRLMGQWQLYAHDLRMLRGLLSDADPLLAPTGPAHCSLAQLRQHREDLKCVEMQLQRHLSSYLRTLDVGSQLLSAVGAEMQTQLTGELGALQEVWERSQCMLENRKVLTDTVLQNWEHCQARLASSRCGLEEVKARLKQPLPELLEELRVTEKLTTEIEGSLDEWVHSLKELAPMKTDLARYIITADMALLQGLQQQLHSQWEELCEKAFLRKQEISDRFGARTVFEEKRKELCDWLMGMEGKVVGSADLSTKDALDKLNEECMGEMSCLRENKALLERLGERLVAAGGECEEALKDVRDRWQHLSDHIESRVKQLRERLLKEQQLDRHVRGLWAWLSHTEAELALPLLYSTCHSDEIQRMLAKQEALEQDLKQHSESIRSALSLCDTLLSEVDSCSDVESSALRETSCSLSLRWRNICSLSLERRSRIEETGQLWREFLDEHSRFEDWLRAAEQTTADPKSADVLYTSAKEEAKKFEVLQREVQERISHLEVLNKLYRQLARENRIDTTGKLKAKVHEANRRWDSLHGHMAAILRRLKYFTTQWEEFEGLQEGLMVWLTELDLQLTNMEHLSESEAHDKLRQLTAMQQDIDLNGNKVNQLRVSGERLIQRSAAADAVLIEEQLNELHSYCQEVFGRVDRFHYRLTHPRVVSEREQDMEESTERSLEKEEGEGRDAKGDVTVQQGLCHLATPQEHLASRALASEDPIPLERDHTEDVSASSSREGEEEKASFCGPPSGTFITEPLSQPSQEPQEKRHLYQDVIQSLGSSLAHTSTPCKQGYAKLMLECSGSIDRVKRVSLILDDAGDESPAEQGLTGLTAADKQSGVIHRWEVLQALSPKPCAHDQPHRPTSDLSSITAWLGQVLPELQQLEGPHPPASIRDLESSVKRLKEMQRTFDRYKAVVISLNLSGQEPRQGEGDPGMEGEGKPDMAGEGELSVVGEGEPGMVVAADVRSMNLAWQEACTHLERWEESLRSALMRCQEFHEVLHSTLLWLAHAEGQLFAVNIHDPSLEPDTLRSHHDTLTGLERDLQERQQQMNALEEISSQLLLEARAEAGEVGEEGKEGAEAKEKLHVISNKLRLLLREVARYWIMLSSETEGDRTIQEQEGETVVGEPPTENRSVARRDPSPPRSFFYRVLRAAFPLHLLLLLLLVLACLVPPSEEDYSCSLSNNFARSLYPMLHYTNGPPPT
ncbi:hypothetical protein MATL_G00208680 [Megalops atlanticus]|uniref:Nesprin-2-like n=1 Tax=Megalops atlanticus TaxID=7932 RepID=A0A9D3PML2_MEGAT|nr:hypothetical protein MATL_G00208680 [Megalops atlanticus]